MVACARRAASTRVCLTASRLLMASRSRSNNSRSRWRPRAFNLLTLLFPSGPSTAHLLRRILRHRFTTEKFPPRGRKIDGEAVKLWCSRSMYGPVFAIARKKRVPRATWSAPTTTFFSCIHSAGRYCENDFSARAEQLMATAVKRRTIDGEGRQEVVTGAVRDTMGGEEAERMTKQVTPAAA